MVCIVSPSGTQGPALSTRDRSCQPFLFFHRARTCEGCTLLINAYMQHMWAGGCDAPGGLEQWAVHEILDSNTPCMVFACSCWLCALSRPPPPHTHTHTRGGQQDPTPACQTPPACVDEACGCVKAKRTGAGHAGRHAAARVSMRCAHLWGPVQRSAPASSRRAFPSFG